MGYNMNKSGLFSLSLLYTDQTDLESFIRQRCNITDKVQGDWLVCIHTCIHNQTEASRIAKQVNSFLPYAHIIGTSASSVIYNGSIYDDQCLIIFTHFDKSYVQVHNISYSSYTPSELAHLTKHLLLRPNTRAMMTFFPGSYHHAQEFVDSLADLRICFPIVGGLASPNKYGSFLFNEYGAYENNFMFAAFNSDFLQTYGGIIGGHEPFSEEYIITEIDENEIVSVNLQPAVPWFKEKLQVDKFFENNMTPEDIQSDTLLRFPIVMSDDIHYSRFLRYSEHSGRLSTYSAQTNAGQKFRISYLSPLTAASELKEICYQLRTKPCQVIFSYSCVFRKTFLNHCSEWELEPFSECNINGAFMYGELGSSNGSNIFSTGSNCILGFSESDHAYLPINTTPLENFQILDDDWNNVYQHMVRIQKKQSESINFQISSQVLEQERNIRNTIFVDKDTGLHNITKYRYDKVRMQFNKICMISIEKAIVISGRLGENALKRLLCKNIHQVRELLDNENYNLYIYDNSSFFFTAPASFPDSLFLRKTEQIFEMCGSCFSDQFNITAVNNFYVVINEQNLLEKVQFCISSCVDKNTRYHVYNPDNTVLVKEIDDRITMTNVISDAIIYNRVVPYFQAIHDNKTGQFHHYEALMRIADRDGKIYSPGQFLEISKDYHLYLQLSHIMIQKVIDIFRRRKGSVFLNLSAYDINSEYIRKFIYDLLDNLPESVCSRITFEILESEELKSFDDLTVFINHVRSRGVKIAIDDFGSGYSNMSVIIRIQPDYIKIDGDIIINCDQNPTKQICLKAISTIANSLNAQMIAERVENADEQKVIEDTGIQFTQGYYFAKPVPYTHLKDDIAN